MSDKNFRSLTKITQPIKSVSHKFRKNERGAVAIPMGILAVMLFSAVGMAVDYSRSVKAQHHLQDAVDAAVLAAAAFGESSYSEAEAAANSIFDGTTAEKIKLDSVTRSLTAQGSVYAYTAEAKVSTMLLQLVGYDSFEIAAHATAGRRIKGTEIVIGLDTTGSMGFGNSWDNAKEAMSDLLVDLDALAETEEDFYATFVPFADRVNVGQTRAEGWLSTAIPSTTEWGQHLVESGNYANTGKGCLEPREELIDGNPHTLTDDTPSTLGFRPTALGHYQSYLSKRNSFTCPAQPLMGPTTNIGSFASQINALNLSGTGRFDNTMAWMHRLLSPKWQGLWDTPGYPAAYDERRKMAIFITDMYTNGFHYEVPNQITNTKNTPNFGNNQATPKGLENFVEVCERMKADGIEIHTIYVNGNQHGIPYMKACATSESNYHAVTDVAGLRKSLQKISTKLVDVRLRH